MEENLAKAARRIKLLLMDCDGVLTDGRLYFTARGEEMKAFNVRDGQGLALWHRAGFRSGIISGRDSGLIVQARAEELGIEFVITGSRNKIEDLNRIIADAGVSPGECAFIGDDIGDIDAIRSVGLGIAVADAEESVIATAGLVTQRPGGKGAVREVIDLLLRSKFE